MKDRKSELIIDHLRIKLLFEEFQFSLIASKFFKWSSIFYAYLHISKQEISFRMWYAQIQGYLLQKKSQNSLTPRETQIRVNGKKQMVFPIGKKHEQNNIRKLNHARWEN